MKYDEQQLNPNPARTKPSTYHDHVKAASGGNNSNRETVLLVLSLCKPKTIDQLLVDLDWRWCRWLTSIVTPPTTTTTSEERLD